MTKTCTKCREEKLLSEFYACKAGTFGRAVSCKKCFLEYCKQRRDDPVTGAIIRERKNRQQKKKYHNDSDYREKQLKRERARKVDRSEYHRERNKRPEVREITRAAQRAWWRNNPEKAKARNAKNYNAKKNKPMFKLNNAIHAGISESLRSSKNRRKWQNLVGYTIAELKKHLETQFAEGMAWQNYGKWHVDHIIPQSFFKFNSPEDTEFKMCWRLENLQPMWGTDNIRKGNRLIRRAC